MEQYEVAILFDPGLEIDLDKTTVKIEKIFKDNGGKLLNEDNWGKRKLAYPINKQDHALYVFYNLQLPCEAVQKIEAALNITDEVIRFLITKPDLKAMAKAEAARADKAKKAAERGESAANEASEDSAKSVEEEE